MRIRTLDAIVLAMSAAILVTGCARRPVAGVAAVPAPSGAAVAAAAQPTAAVSGPKAAAGPQAPARAPTAQATAPRSTARPSPGDFAAVPQLRDIHFDFDKDEIRPGDARILDANAAWLKANRGQLVLIEGHCDERGTNEYNVALGERRAKATFNYLVSRGVEATRVTTISYGEERPLCTAHDEVCWSQNRRAHFLVKPG